MAPFDFLTYRTRSNHTSQSEKKNVPIDTTHLIMITSEPEAPTCPSVTQSDRENAMNSHLPVVLPDLVGGDTLHHVLIPNLLLLTSFLGVAKANVGLGGDINNPDHSDN